MNFTTSLDHYLHFSEKGRPLLDIDRGGQVTATGSMFLVSRGFLRTMIDVVHTSIIMNNFYYRMIWYRKKQLVLTSEDTCDHKCVGPLNKVVHNYECNRPDPLCGFWERYQSIPKNILIPPSPFHYRSTRRRYCRIPSALVWFTVLSY